MQDQCRTLHFELLSFAPRLKNRRSIVGLGQYFITFFPLQDFLFKQLCLGLVSLLGIWSNLQKHELNLTLDCPKCTVDFVCKENILIAEGKGKNNTEVLQEEYVPIRSNDGIRFIQL